MVLFRAHLCIAVTHSMEIQYTYVIMSQAVRKLHRIVIYILEFNCIVVLKPQLLHRGQT